MQKLEIDKNVHYTYPEDLDLKPGSELHDTIVAFVTELASASHNVLTSRHQTWKQIDDMVTMFVRPTFYEEALKQEDSKQPISIVLPMSFANLQIMMTFAVGTLLEDPILKFKPVDSKDVVGAYLHQELVNQQLLRNGCLLELHTAIRNCMCYGISPLVLFWDRQFKNVTRRGNGMFDTGLTAMAGPIRERRLTFEGNRVAAADPYVMLLDLSAGTNNFQASRFFGFVETTNLYDLLGREAEQDSGLFNVKYLRGGDKWNSKFSMFSERQKSQSKNFAARNMMMPVDVVWMYVKIIPAELGMGDSRLPELWLVGIAGDNVVVYMDRLDLDHDMIPAVLMSPLTDGHSPLAISPIQTTAGAQVGIDFMWNNFMDNNARTTKSIFAVDPFIINLPDLVDPENGWLVRVRPSAQGLGKIDDGIRQIPIQNVTQENIGNIAVLREYMQYALGTNENLSGSYSSKKERISSAETNASNTFSTSRLGYMVWVMSQQMLPNLGYMMASQNRQLMSDDMLQRAIGNLRSEIAADLGLQESDVSTDMLTLDVDTDVVVQSKQYPGAVNMQALTNMTQLVMSNPALQGLFDLPRLVSHMFRHSGLPNVGDFMRRVNVQVMPDADVAQQAEAGNLVPTNGATL